ncbi:MAG: hypothetical protein ABR501_06130 [Pyrinomonadaceae bacterium]
MKKLKFISLGTIVFSLFIVGEAAQAIPCDRVRSNPDKWTITKVDLFVRTARAAFEGDSALPAYHRVLDEISDAISKCRLSEDIAFMNRFRIFVEYIQTASLERKPDHKLGLRVTDEQYFDETGKYVQIPEFLLDQSFLRFVSAFETLERAKSYLRHLNSQRNTSEQFIFFSYRSRHLGTPDNGASYRRLLIVVPGNVEKGVPDKWVQFGVTDPGAQRRVRNVSVVAAIPRSDGTSNIYFKDYYRTYGRGVITIKGRWELGEGDDNCLQCHKSGVLPIFPARGSVSLEEQDALMAVNNLFRSYGPARFGEYLDETKFGPGLSAVSLGNRIRRFGSSFEKGVIARAMSCASCHSQQRLGALNWPMDSVLIKSFVNSGHMPPGYRLKISERRELYDKLIQEYFGTESGSPGILKSWLLGLPQITMNAPTVNRLKIPHD